MYLLSYFLFRINDDTVFLTKNWTHALVNTLFGFSPTNIGVVGPSHYGGNQNIITYDFVHRMHVNIHGFYYPRFFTDWFADSWITDTYKRVYRMTKLKDVQLIHTMSTGQRYQEEKSKAIGLFHAQLSAQVVHSWLNLHLIRRTRRMKSSNGRKIISFSIEMDTDDNIACALRNLVLASELLPDWNVRFYVNNQFSTHNIELLLTYGAQVVLVDSNSINLSSIFWAYLVADDPLITHFLVRSIKHRLSPRQVPLIWQWEDQSMYFHTIRDRPWHVGKALVADLVGAKRLSLCAHLEATVYNLLLMATQHGIGDVNQFLNDVLWPMIQEHVVSHDSISAYQWNNSIPFDKLMHDELKIGQIYDQYEQEVYYVTVESEMKDISNKYSKQ